jgi:hypothetical protein
LFARWRTPLHRGRSWTWTGFTDLNHRASHPRGIFDGTPFSVFAKLDCGRSAGRRRARRIQPDPMLRSAYAQLASVDPGFADRRELRRLHGTSG